MELMFVTVLFLGLIVLGVPMYSIGISSLAGIATISGVPNTMIPMKMFYGQFLRFIGSLMV